MDRIVVISELGINHNGSVLLAKQLMDVAKAKGCDYVKFQKRSIDLVYTQDFLNQPRESPFGSTQRDQKEGLEFGQDEYEQIEAYSKKIGLPWFASAWDIPSLEFLEQFNPPYVKIASAMATHLGFVDAAVAKGRSVLLSTGMMAMDDLYRAENAGYLTTVCDRSGAVLATNPQPGQIIPLYGDRATSVWRHPLVPLTLLHCVSEYPCPDERLNLAMIPRLREEFHVPVGYSAHQVSPIPSIIAAAMGASVIEAHITLDRAMYGSDQSASLEPRGLEIMVKGIRSVETTRGDGVKRITPQEALNAKKLRYWL